MLGLFSGRLIFRRGYHRRFALQNRLDLIIKTALGTKTTAKKQLIKANPKSPWGYIREGLLTEGFLRLRFGGFFSGGLFFGGEGLFSEGKWGGGGGLLSEFYGTLQH